MVAILLRPMLASQLLGAIIHCRKSGAGASLSYEYMHHHGGGAVALGPGQGLPWLSRPVLRDSLARLGEQERLEAFARGTIPVARVGCTVFHALCDGKTAPPGMAIACRISPAEFEAAMEQVCGWSLAEQAAQSLRIKTPGLSADVRLRNGQAWWLGALGVGLLVLFWAVPLPVALHVLALVLTPFYDMMIWLRLSALIATARSRAETWPAVPVPDADLPSYSILVPLFKETAVLPQLLAALTALDYPQEKLDVKLILEESDLAMHRAIGQLVLPDHVSIITVPEGRPRTKPRALNYALNFARGELLTIFDAEDVPEPSQLRKAASAFARAPWKLACLQAELAFFNARENWLTQQFAIEYATLFRLILPQLAQARLPLPLGGTSNHFRTAVLREIGGWDAHNVTEDADLGFRLARFGCQTGVLASITYEEANTEIGNWLHQRARWFKGFLQTWLVHMRNPGALVAESGWTGFLGLQASVAGVVVSSALYPLFLALTANDALSAPQPSAFSVAFLAHFTAGSGIMAASSLWALRQKHLLSRSLWLTPAYWVLASVAAWIAIWQLLTNPFHWNKTHHGLSALFRPGPVNSSSA